jgi:hypothetical protein
MAKDRPVKLIKTIKNKLLARPTKTVSAILARTPSVVGKTLSRAGFVVSRPIDGFALETTGGSETR